MNLNTKHQIPQGGNEFDFLGIHQICDKFSCQKNMQMIRSFIFYFAGWT